MALANYYDMPAQNLIDTISALNSVIRWYTNQPSQTLTIEQVEQLRNLRRERKNAKTAFTRRKIQMSLFEVIP